jgi:hypothetical protein
MIERALVALGPRTTWTIATEREGLVYPLERVASGEQAHLLEIETIDALFIVVFVKYTVDRAEIGSH